MRKVRVSGVSPLKRQRHSWGKRLQIMFLTSDLTSRLIVNAGKLSMPEKKRLGKKYTTYSGYPGGLKTERLGALNARKGHGEPLRRAIERMLPRNTLRVGRMKNLTITG